MILSAFFKTTAGRKAALRRSPALGHAIVAPPTDTPSKPTAPTRDEPTPE